MAPACAFKEVSDPQASRAWRPRRLLGIGMTQSIDRVSLAVDEGLACHAPREQARTLVKSRLFALLSCGAILSHSAVIGMEQARCLRGATSGNDLTSAKYAIVSFYVLELLLHAFGHGLADVYRNRVRLFDAFILCGFFSAEAAISGYPRPKDPPLFLRILRLLPLLRILEAIDSFGFVRVLMRAFWPSTGVMCHAMVLLMLFFYILSVIGVDIIGMHNYTTTAGAPAEVLETASAYFSSVPASMLTLVQFVCLDSIGAIYRPLIVSDAGLALYFLTVTLLMPIVLMKMVTGEIFRIMQDHMEQERDKEKLAAKSALAGELNGVFSRLDEDRSGQISREEILHINNEDRQVLNHCTKMYDPLDIFTALDPDQTGNLDVQTFCDGVWTLATQSVRIQEHQAQKHVSSIFRRLEGLEASQAKLGESLGRALALQRGLRKTLGSEGAGWLKAAGDEDVAEVRWIGL